MKFTMKYFLLLFFCSMLTLSEASHAFTTEHSSDEVHCVRYCVQRTVTLMCTNYGPDFCTPYPETACIPHCQQRSITKRCLAYGPDFCGLAPSCQLYCQKPSLSGQCLQYGSDQCFGD